ncbi:MAG: glycosyltransferase family 4 protein [Deltaproteobacteria bacterium]|nr:glycosyltransferase family 4 protein [Deltaproteobacteria bacterium]
MHIIMIGPRELYPRSKAGLDAYVRELSQHLAVEGHKVIIYCHRHDASFPLPPGITVKTVWAPKKHHLDTFCYGLLASLSSLCHKDAIVHYHGGSALFAWIPRLFRKKTFLTIHSIEGRAIHLSRINRFFYFLGEWVGVKSVNAMSAVSQTLQKELESQYKKTVSTIPPSMAVKHCTTTGKLATLGLKPKNYLLFLGRIEKGKGVEILLEAFKTSNPKMPCPLVIAGAPLHDNAYLQKLKESAPPGVFFVGSVFGVLKEELLTNALLYIQASQSEGLSISLLEAMSCACPVLASDIRQNQEASGPAGYFFQNGNIGDLCRQLQRLLAEPQQLKEAGERGKSKIETDYAWSQIYPRIMKWYDGEKVV